MCWSTGYLPVFFLFGAKQQQNNSLQMLGYNIVFYCKLFPHWKYLFYVLLVGYLGIIPTSGGAAQCLRAQTGYRFDFLNGRFLNGQCIVGPQEKHFKPITQQRGHRI